MRDCKRNIPELFIKSADANIYFLKKISYTPDVEVGRVGPRRLLPYGQADLTASASL